MMKALIALVLLVAVIYAEDFTRVDLTNTNKNAVCNDGSPAIYFYRKGSADNANNWVIYLEGGGWCVDVDDCKARNASTPHFMTSKMLPLTLNDSTVSRDVNHGGIMSGNPAYNPHFYNANQVYVWYCTSDFWAGLKDASAATNNWAFHGSIVVETVFASLIKTTGFKSAQNVLLTGFSAGGIGTSFNTDRVRQIVKAAVPNVNYKSYVDSGWILDLPQYRGAPENARLGMKLGMTNWNLQLNEDCAAAYSKINQLWRCMFADYAQPYLQSETFWAQHQFDTPFIGGAYYPYNATSYEYVTVAKNTLITDQSNVSGLFNPNCYAHGVESYNDRWNVIQVAGVTPSSAVWKWFTGAPNSIVRYVETCTEFACSKNCPPVEVDLQSIIYS